MLGEDPLARAALARALRERSASVRVSESPDDAGPPDAVLWDVGLHPPEGALALPQGTPAPVVALVPDEEAAEAALQAGARGVLLRDATPGQLLAALAAAVEGLAVLSPPLVPSAADAQGSARTSDDATELTPREREVLALLAEGLSNRAIAARLGVSEHTAKFHVNALLMKLGARGRTEAVVRAARRGWVTL